MFAGTRYLKRGINNEGYSANDVETEQILHDRVGGIIFQFLYSYHALSKTRSQILVKFIIFCVSKLKVKYSFLLVSWKYWVDFHVSKLKVKIRFSFMPTSSKTLNTYLICFESFTQFEGRQKSGKNFLMFCRLRKLKIHISWAIIRFWKINPWFSSFFGLL